MDKRREEELAAMSREARDRKVKKENSKAQVNDNHAQLQREDSVYYELNENDQLVREQTKKSNDDSIYYELDENGELVQEEPKPSSSRIGKASYSRHAGNVTLKPPQRSGILCIFVDCG